MYFTRYWTGKNFEAVAQLKKVAEEHNHKLTQFALAWILNNPAVTSVISGVTSLEQLKDNEGASDVQLTKEEFTACDELWQKLVPSRFLYGR
jgi:aryl-alcohol dehydrogenase-like predicted oxidoreductase